MPRKWTPEQEAALAFLLAGLPPSEICARVKKRKPKLRGRKAYPPAYQATVWAAVRIHQGLGCGPEEALRLVHFKITEAWPDERKVRELNPLPTPSYERIKGLYYDHERLLKRTPGAYDLAEAGVKWCVEQFGVEVVPMDLRTK